MDKPDECAVSASRGRSLLPGWMVSNIERLHTFTDFEQYASSPPETESFIPEHPADSESTSSDTLGNINTLPSEGLESPVKKSHASSCVSSAHLSGKYSGEERCLQLPKHQSVVDAIKFEDILYSSPDVTPCATPDASPMPQRKLSLKSQDTVQANPKKWFYIESIRDRKHKQTVAVDDHGQLLSGKLSELRIRDKRDKPSDNKSKAQCTGNTMKLAISNFDINAISPSSW